MNKEQGIPYLPSVARLFAWFIQQGVTFAFFRTSSTGEGWVEVCVFFDRSSQTISPKPKARRRVSSFLDAVLYALEVINGES